MSYHKCDRPVWQKFLQFIQALEAIFIIDRASASGAYSPLAQTPQNSKVFFLTFILFKVVRQEMELVKESCMSTYLNVGK